MRTLTEINRLARATWVRAWGIIVVAIEAELNSERVGDSCANLNMTKKHNDRICPTNYQPSTLYLSLCRCCIFDVYIRYADRSSSMVAPPWYML